MAASSTQNAGAALPRGTVTFLFTAMIAAGAAMTVDEAIALAMERTEG